ncbi:MAG: UDP-3-O-(3-hydroxymyristoyl)glucosamine N-acyltransferase [Betaproteobacteria bacterium]|nr:MAG: UDP-3-O-(3-hydroxymyristoyl)glucosamine N-acyltransferase [Betaproteobacteria bacterium]
MGRAADRPISAQTLASAIGAKYHGSAEATISGVASLETATSSELSFLADTRYRGRAEASLAGFLLVRDEFVSMGSSIKLVHPAPHLAFAKALEILFPVAPVVPGVSARAVVDSTATVDGAEIRGNASVGRQSVIGVGTVIHSNASVGDNVTIGRDCVIRPGVSIYDGCVIGDRCIIHSGTVIGADGFGFQPTASGWVKVAQVGRVIIGNDVEIGSNTSIDCGAIEDTVIGNGVKIDNLVQIAHNCRVGDHTAIAGCAGLAGSTIVGARCMIGGGAMLTGHMTVCDDAVISGGTLVSSSVTDPGRITGVFPSLPHRDWMKMAATLRRSIKK